jgi:hypothetical protein
MKAMCISVGCGLLAFSYRVLFHNCSPETTEEYLLLDTELLNTTYLHIIGMLFNVEIAEEYV